MRRWWYCVMGVHMEKGRCWCERRHSPLFGMPRAELVETVMRGVRRAKADPRSLRITAGQRRYITERRAPHFGSDGAVQDARPTGSGEGTEHG